MKGRPQRGGRRGVARARMAGMPPRRRAAPSKAATCPAALQDRADQASMKCLPLRGDNAAVIRRGGPVHVDASMKDHPLRAATSAGRSPSPRPTRCCLDEGPPAQGRRLGRGQQLPRHRIGVASMKSRPLRGRPRPGLPPGQQSRSLDEGPPAQGRRRAPWRTTSPCGSLLDEGPPDQSGDQGADRPG